MKISLFFNKLNKITTVKYCYTKNTAYLRLFRRYSLLKFEPQIEYDQMFEELFWYAGVIFEVRFDDLKVK